MNDDDEKNIYERLWQLLFPNRQTVRVKKILNSFFLSETLKLKFKTIN